MLHRSQIKTSTQIKYTNLLGQQVLILKEWSVLKKVFIDWLILPCVFFFIILFRSENSSVRRAFLCRPQFVCLSRESVLGHPSIFMWGGQGVGWSTRGMDLPVFGTVLLYMRPGEGANLDKHTPPKHSYFLHLRHRRKRWGLNGLYRFRAMWCTWWCTWCRSSSVVICFLFVLCILYFIFCILYFAHLSLP